MIISGIIIGIGVLAATFAVVKNWSEIKQWFKDFVSALADIFTYTLKGVAHAAAAFMEVVKSGIEHFKHKLYYKEENHYVEEIRVREVQEDQLPAWARQKLNPAQETNVTREIENEIQLTL